MGPEAAGGVAWAVVGGGGGNRAAEREQALRDDGRRLAAERELQSMSGAFMCSAAILTIGMMRSSAHPRAWMLRARETGEQLLRARLCELLRRSAIVLAAALIGVLLAHQARLRAAAPAERVLAAARALFGAFIAVYMAWGLMTAKESWGETAAGFCILFGIAAAYWLLVWIGKWLLGPARVSRFECWMEERLRRCP